MNAQPERGPANPTPYGPAVCMDCRHNVGHTFVRQCKMIPVSERDPIDGMRRYPGTPTEKNADGNCKDYEPRPEYKGMSEGAFAAYVVGSVVALGLLIGVVVAYGPRLCQ